MLNKIGKKLRKDSCNNNSNSNNNGDQTKEHKSRAVSKNRRQCWQICYKHYWVLLASIVAFSVEKARKGTRLLCGRRFHATDIEKELRMGGKSDDDLETLGRR